ncbi:helix-hairpin-helix domain-containing protein [Streptomyces xanthii]|uniref:DNA helicase RecD n=1 Tax=Streptomyces xanthii TaxID=2768069 RepID=A0A7H1BEL9_9ACTN|nr:helix-hairpin-helix domain-containing protein [Streptomyces xanthii]QNS07174.1 DNA helicase RecD [Streptomyces xanthii]
MSTESAAEETGPAPTPDTAQESAAGQAPGPDDAAQAPEGEPGGQVGGEDTHFPEPDNRATDGAGADAEPSEGTAADQDGGSDPAASGAADGRDDEDARTAGQQAAEPEGGDQEQRGGAASGSTDGEQADARAEVAAGQAAEHEGAEQDAPHGSAAGSTEDAPADARAETADGSESAGDGDGQAPGDAATGEGAQVSEAEAELAAQREFRERIAQRKASKEGPIDAGAKLSGTAADLLAAVRAVESGGKPASSVFTAPAPARAPEPARTPEARPAATPAPEQGPRPGVPGPARAVAGPGAEAVAAVRAVLGEGGAPESLAAAAAGALGEGAEERLREDPWQLLRVPGVRPEQADGFARALLGAECGPDDERRGCAVAVWLLEQAALAGHTALDLPVLAEALGKYAVTDPEAAVQSAVAEGDALVLQDPLDEPPAQAAAPEQAEEEGEEPERPVRILVGLERYAMAEESLADGLARLVNAGAKDATPPAGWEEAATRAKGSTAELLRAVAAHRLVLHTGGEAARAEPVAVAKAAAGLGLRVCVAAHSADGRRRAAELLGPDAPREVTATVAGLVAHAEGPGRDADGALALDLLVVLDAPQLDVDGAALLVEQLPDGAGLLLSGDPGTLWSAGPGRVFADLLAAAVCPRIASRTPDFGPIGELVSGIGIGELNAVEAPGKEVVIVPVRDAAEAIHRTVQLVADSVPRAIGVPAEQTQVITVGHGGAAGTRALNAALKERLNPGPGRFGGFDPGDRVVHVPAPGRIRPGRVLGADAEGLRLDCDGEPVLVPKDRVEQAVRHGWAVTGHQAVGLRWPAAVVVLPGDATQGLTRPWVYTAFGRGERHLSVVHGADAALPRAVAELPAKPRTTRLQTLVRGQIPAS